MGTSASLDLLAQDGLSGELDLVALFADALDHDLLAFFQLVADILDPAVGYLNECQVSCTKSGSEAQCRSFCQCTLDQLKELYTPGLLAKMLGGNQ